MENVKTSDIEVVAGVMNLMSDDRVKVAVKRIIRHPNYKIVKNEKNELQELDWDLALLELEESLDIEDNGKISKAVLPPPAVKHIGKEITISGWGKTNQYDGYSLEQIQSINVTIKTTEDCLKTFPVNYHEDRMFCAGIVSTTTCKGDSMYI